MKKVSVIVPVYGVEQYIADTVRSVLCQTYQNFELILVDDGGSDRSIEICQQFSDPRIKIIRQANRGLAGARNTGIRHANGEYIAFLDGDDLWDSQKLEQHIQHLERSPELGISYSRSILIDAEGQSLNSYLLPRLTNINLPYFLRENPLGNGSSAVFRRSVFDAIRFQDNLYGTVEDFYFDEHFRQAEDIECWLRILIQTPWKFEGIPEALTLYRVNPEGLSANLYKQLAALEQVLVKMNTYAPAVVKQWGNRGMAHQLRTLARTAIRMKSGATAVDLMHRALLTHWQIALEMPRPIFMTLVAAYLMWLLPHSLYIRLEDKAVKIFGILQRYRIQQEMILSGAKMRGESEVETVNP